jgi:NTE family protein
MKNPTSASMWGFVSPAATASWQEEEHNMIAFVLSGGGNRGALQAGALQALLERGVRPNLIVGTSVGALNGIGLAADPTPEGARRLAEHWKRLRRADVFPGNAFTVGWRILTGQGSLHSRVGFERYALTTMPPGVRRFKDLKIPCVVTAASLASGQMRLFGSDPNERLLGAIMASTAIPPFFPPYRYADEWLVDGAIVANLPLWPAIERGARTIYALEIVDELPNATRYGMLATLSSSLTVMLSRQHEQERRAVALAHQRGVVVHDIRLFAGRSMRYDDFGSGAELVDAGERAALEYLDALPAAAPPPLARVALTLRDALRALAARRQPAPSAPPPA